MKLKELYECLAQTSSLSPRKVADLKNAGLSVAEIARRYARSEKHRPCQEPFVTPACSSYPSKLTHLNDPPLRVFHQGRNPGELPATIVGVVGSRKASRFGLAFARQLGEVLSRRGAGVCSGLALGIDGAVHEGVLSYLARDPDGGPPIAVLGHGLGTIHPSSHRSLARAVARTGTLLTEYPPGTPASRWTFPARNRIIAALSDHLVVVEAGPKSGSLYTAEFADELGRQVWIVPTAPGRPNSEGVLKLWDSGVNPITNIEEFAERVAPTSRRDASPLILTPAKREVLRLLAQSGGSTEHLCEESELSAMELACLLSESEMEGHLRRMLDGTWEVNRVIHP